MSHVVVIGCGIVGAAIAYELSQVSGLTVTVLDSQAPAQGATIAALGVLMAVISQKAKGKTWQLRQNSLERYETLIPELEALCDRTIPYNRKGILKLCLEGEDLSQWERLIAIRQSQGWQLNLLSPSQVQSQYPHLCCDRISAAIYSPQDRQVNPVALTQAFVTASQQKGVIFQFGVKAEAFTPNSGTQNSITSIQTNTGTVPADWVVIAAGLGSTPLTQNLAQTIDIQPVLGQALHLQTSHPLHAQDLQPVITGDDVHLVPVGDREYWVGATVEFPSDRTQLAADPDQLHFVLEKAIAFCPALATAKILRTWSGLRPRPEQRAAPVLGYLPGYTNVLLATGHYRNGVLLAPATAQAIRATIVAA